MKSEKNECVFCGYRAKGTAQLNGHLRSRSHLNERPYFCALCPQEFISTAHLSRHVKVVHKKLKEFDCGVCGRATISLRRLLIHSRVHTGLKPYPCSQCDKRFAENCRLNQHMKYVHQKDSLGRFPCDLCSKSFQFKSKLAVHVDQVHKKVKRFECKDCDAAFYNEASLKIHQRVHTAEKPFVCSWWRCGKTFSQKSKLDHHRKSVHGKVKRYECTFCGVRIAAKHNLETHIRRHINELPYPCTWCGDKEFVTRRELEYHRRVCRERKANTNSELTRFACDVCNKSFAFKQGLTRHVERVHKKVENFMCPVCDKMFYSKYNAEVHIRSHTGERPFKCGWHKCGKKFVSSGHLSRHVKRTHEKLRKGLDCIFCGKLFYENGGLERHMRIHTKECVF